MATCIRASSMRLWCLAVCLGLSVCPSASEQSHEEQIAELSRKNTELALKSTELALKSTALSGQLQAAQDEIKGLKGHRVEMVARNSGVPNQNMDARQVPLPQSVLSSAEDLTHSSIAGPQHSTGASRTLLGKDIGMDFSCEGDLSTFIQISPAAVARTFKKADKADNVAKKANKRTANKRTPEYEAKTKALGFSDEHDSISLLQTGYLCNARCKEQNNKTERRNKQRERSHKAQAKARERNIKRRERSHKAQAKARERNIKQREQSLKAKHKAAERNEKETHRTKERSEKKSARTKERSDKACLPRKLKKEKKWCGDVPILSPIPREIWKLQTPTMKIRGVGEVTAEYKPGLGAPAGHIHHAFEVLKLKNHSPKTRPLGHDAPGKYPPTSPVFIMNQKCSAKLGFYRVSSRVRSTIDRGPPVFMSINAHIMEASICNLKTNACIFRKIQVACYLWSASGGHRHCGKKQSFGLLQ